MASSVILKNEDQLQFAPIGQALAAHRGVPTLDTVNEAKHCWGIMAENIEDAEARKLVESLALVGLLGLVVPQESMRTLPIPVMIDALDEVEGGFRMVTDDETVHELKSGEVRVVGAAAFKSVTQRTIEEKQGPTAGQRAASIGIMLATGLPISIGPKSKTVHRTISDSELSFVLDIVAENPLRRFRIQGNHLNYAFLKERMLPNAMGNFRILLSDVVFGAPHARRSRGTRILIANQPVTAMGYGSLADLERECRWLQSIPAQAG